MKRIFALLSCALLGNFSMASDINYPLFLSNNVDPNVLFNLSIEGPMGGAAYNDEKGNLPGGNYCNGRVNGWGTCYFPKETYLGYFDSEKCYSYNSSKKYFEPNSAVNNSNRECSSKFSGNFMNWATMTSIDMFIMTTTGGNRIVDESNGSGAKTVIKKAASSGFFHSKLVKSSLNVTPSKVTPFSFSELQVLKNGSSVTFKSGNYSKSYNVDVRVCDSSISGLGLGGLEENCDKYTHATKGDYYKPQGLIQNNANTMRFAATSFARDNSKSRDGGVLRANMKYVGTQLPSSLGSSTDNPNKEFSAEGTFLQYPDAKTHSSNQYTGIINYINHFNEHGYKSYDPASELFYESIRYFKNLGPTADYSSGISLANEKFPLITNWQDPIQHSCQKNFIIGMNDAYSWLDKKLPGTYFTQKKIGSFTASNNDYGEPSNADSSINVRSLTNAIGSIEGINSLSCANGNKSLGDCAYTGRHASFYIAGLAHYANTQDIRSDLDGKQTITSFIIDSQEYKSSPSTGNTNMLWLAGKYGGYIDEDGDGTPKNADGSNKEWDVDGDGSPDNYVLASNPQRIVEGLSEAFEQIIERTASGTGVSLSSNNLSSNTLLFQPTFNNDDWSGDVVAYEIDDDVVLDNEKWRASEELPAYGARNIFSHDGTTGIKFKYNKISTSQKNQITKNQLNYLRGQQTKELSNGGDFRNRSTLLGDIIHSTPTVDYQYDYGFDSLAGNEGDRYLTYRNSTNYSNRPEMLYIAANDGMLRAINTSSGKEIFGYVPGSYYAELAEFTDPAYQHNYLLDGEITLGDAYLASQWKTVLIGSRGRGGSTIFALDVSDPSNFEKSDVLWEVSAADTDFSDLGIQLGKAKIIRLNNGKWAAVFGNGYHRDTPLSNPNSEAHLYIVDLENGSLIKKIAAPSSGLNGLSDVSTIDKDNDHKTDFVYAGDLLGNMWKFDISSTDTDDWAVAHTDMSSNPEPLFNASYTLANTSTNVAQPITVAPTIIKHHIKGYVLLFGTGKYYEAEDNTLLTNDPVNSFYGIHDDLSLTAGTRDNLTAQSILYESNDFNTGTYRGVSNNTLDYNQKNGWYIDLISPGTNTTSAEKVVLQALFHDDKVIFFTLTPSQDPCYAGGTSWTMILNALDGRAGDTSVSDENNDGKVDESDKTTVTDENGNDISIVVSGSKHDSIISGGVIAKTATGETVLITSDTKGNTQKKTLATAKGDSGRISWQQIR